MCRCPSLETVEELDVQLFANGESGLSTFSTSVFKFAQYESAYLHAEVKICFTEKDTCPKKVEIFLFKKMVEKIFIFQQNPKWRALKGFLNGIQKCQTIPGSRLKIF